jgi:hypothetical protein
VTDNYLKVLRADPRSWLLESDNPSVRLFTLIDLMDRAPASPSVKKAGRDIRNTGMVPAILFKQNEGGYWESPEDFYVRKKYRGTVWQMIVLAELGVDGGDPRIRRACEFIVKWSQDPDSGGFAHLGSERGGRHSGVIPCLTGNMAWSLVRFGYLGDPRLRQAIEWITMYQRLDDGIDEPPSGWPYDRYQQCWGTHTCHMGVVKALKALAEIPPPNRSPAEDRFIRSASEYLLKHHLYKRSHDTSQDAKSEWLRFGFPLMWNTDALEMLGVLLKLGCRDPRMQEAVDLVISKQDSQGRWTLETTHNGRFQVSIETRNKPSKWVTLKALTALRGFLG